MLSFWFWQTLFLVGLLLTTGGLFVPRTRATVLFGLAVLTWLFGVKTVHYAFQSRGPQWEAAPLRSYEYRTLDGKGKAPRQPAGSRHHAIDTPLEVRRFPRELDSWHKPLLVVLEATLEPEGTVVSPRITCRSGDPALDKALQTAMEKWRFGPVPSGGIRQPELLRVTVKNNYQVTQPGTRFWGFVFAIPLLWGLALWLVPGSPELRPRLQRLLIAVGMLACLGGLLSYRLSPDQQRFQNAEKQQLFLLIGFGMLVLGPRLMAWGRRWLDNSVAGRAKWARFTLGGWTWALLGLGLLVLTLGPLGTTNGSEAKLWLKLPGGNSFQTIELVKVLFAVFLAHRALPLVTNFRATFERAGRMRVRKVSGKQRLLAVAVGFLALLGTVTLMRDFGPVLLIFLFLAALLAVLGEGWLAGGLVAALAVLLVGMHAAGVPERWRTRVTIWRDPWGVTQTDNIPRKTEVGELPSQVPGGKEQVAHALWAASSGGLQGVGWGQGQPQRIKVVESDFPFMAVAEETGLLGAGCVLALTAFLVGSLAALAREATRDDSYEKTFLTAGAALLGGQTLLILAGNLRLFPLTGVTYPFLSYGGASLLMSFGFIVLLVGVAAQPSQHPEFFPEPEEIDRRIGTLQRGITVGLVITGLALLAHVLIPGLARTRKVVHVATGEKRSNPRLSDSGRVVGGWFVAGSLLDREGKKALVYPTPRGRDFDDTLLTPSLTLLHGGDPGQEGRFVTVAQAVGRLLGGQQQGTTNIGDSISLWAGPRHGYSVSLTLDTALQRLAERQLRGRTGAIVGIVPATGEILFAAGRTRDGLGSNWHQRGYAPGSALKTLTLAAALDAKILTMNTRLLCQPDYLGNIGDAHGAVHGWLDARTALEKSCNVYYGQVAVTLGWNRFTSFAQEVGFGSPVALLPAALGTPETGQVSAVASQFRDTRSPASEGNLARTGFGQKDVRMTPLHLALWTATLANRGKEISPTLVRQVTAHNGKVLWTYAPPVGRQVFSERVGEQVVAAMEQVVRSGTGRQAQLSGVRVAGKTGTAQKEPRGQDALFIGFAPVEQPQIAIAVLIEDISDEEGGGTVAAPLAKIMIAATLQSKGRKP